jgi:hypothetical protein
MTIEFIVLGLVLMVCVVIIVKKHNQNKNKLLQTPLKDFANEGLSSYRNYEQDVLISDTKDEITFRRIVFFDYTLCYGYEVGNSVIATINLDQKEFTIKTERWEHQPDLIKQFAHNASYHRALTDEDLQLFNKVLLMDQNTPDFSKQVLQQFGW